MDKEKILECIAYLQNAQSCLGDVSSPSVDDTASLNEAYIYIGDALDLLVKGKEAAQ